MAKTADADRSASESHFDITPRGLLLDFGSVISFSAFEQHRNTERVLNLPSGSLNWLGPLDPGSDPLWAAMQRDEISEREYWATRSRELGEAIGEEGWDMQTMVHRLHHAHPNRVVRPQMEQLIRKARTAGLRIGVLSNELELFYGADLIKEITVLRDMHALVDATHTKILKPDLRAYALGVAALDCAAAEILFVDDQLRNIVGAERAGLQVQHFDFRDVKGSVAAIAARLKLAL